jgi:hypothetical protein
VKSMIDYRVQATLNLNQYSVPGNAATTSCSWLRVTAVSPQPTHTFAPAGQPATFTQCRVSFS